MRSFKKVLLILGVLVGFGMLAYPTTAGAVAVFDPCASSPAKDTSVCAATGTDSAASLIKKIVNILLFFLGAIAVIMIIIGGISYTTSAGDATGVTRAKNTILYSVIGLVVAFSAYAIVNWVVLRVDPTSAPNKCAAAGGTYDAATNTCKTK